MHLKRRRDPLPVSEGFREQKGPHCFIQEVQESTLRGGGRPDFPPLSAVRGGAAAVGELPLSVGGTRHNSMGSVPSCPWSGMDAPGVRQKHGGAPHPAGL